MSKYNFSLPALLIRMSNLVSCCKNSAAKVLTDSKLDRSSFMKATSVLPDRCLISSTAASAFSWLRQASITRALRLARSTAVSLPIPALPPGKYQEKRN